jgi:7 transmembrane receptor (rhodopsin family).
MKISSDTAVDISYTILYTLAVFSNVLFILYLAVQQLKTSVDRLVFSLSVVQLLLVILGIPFVYDVWVGEPYKYGEFACSVIVPLHHILDFSEAFMYAMIAVFIAEKLRGDHEIKWRILGFSIALHVLCIVFVLPSFGVWHLTPSKVNSNNADENTSNCTESWNPKAEVLHRISQAFLFFVPLSITVFHYRKANVVVKFILQFLNTKKSNARYQSFGKVTSNPETSPDSHLCFGESEEMNLEMAHLYQKHNSISTISKDAETSNISVQIFTNEVEIDKIDSKSPLWQGLPKAGEYQKRVVSIKWFRYSRNLYQAFLGSAVFYALASLPFQIFRLYTTARSPYDFNSAEKMVAVVILCLRYITCLVNPWIFMLGIFKFRKSLFGRCYPQPKDFLILPDSGKEDSA